MTVNVGTGQAWVEGTYLTSSESGVVVQGDYWVQNDTVYNLPIPAANSSLGRIDLVCVVVTDSNEGQAGTTGPTIIDVPGTPASSPVAPTPPVSSIVLAQISVPAAATTITSSDITLLYPQATLKQAMQTPVQSISSAGPPTGQYANGSAVLDSGDYLWVNPGGSFIEIKAAPPTPPTFNAGRIYQTTAQTPTESSVIVLTGFTQDWVYGDMTTSSTGITIPTTGLYAANGAVFFNTSGLVLLFITVNGATKRAFETYHGPGVAGADSLQLKAGDVVGLSVNQQISSTVLTETGSEYTWLTVRQIVEA
jgi:hypothetical protein